MRKHLGVATPGYRGEWHAFRQYFTDVGPRASEELFVWFEPDLLPGYAWSFPLPDGRANVGFGIQRDGGKVARVQDMGPLWPQLLARPHIAAVLGPDARPESPHRAWPIPARVDDIVLATRRTLFVGDAAAATDPMTGEGIGQALLTGVLAAEAIEAGGLDAARASRRPTSSGSATPCVADHRMSMLLIRALEAPQGRPHRGADRRRHRLDPPQLRPLAVRGLPPLDHHDAAPLAAAACSPARAPTAEPRRAGTPRGD